MSGKYGTDKPFWVALVHSTLFVFTFFGLKAMLLHESIHMAHVLLTWSFVFIIQFVSKKFELSKSKNNSH